MTNTTAEEIPTGFALASGLDDHLLIALRNGEIEGDGIRSTIAEVVHEMRQDAGLDREPDPWL